MALHGRFQSQRSPFLAVIQYFNNLLVFSIVNPGEPPYLVYRKEFPVLPFIKKILYLNR